MKKLIRICSILIILTFSLSLFSLFKIKEAAYMKEQEYIENRSNYATLYSFSELYTNAKSKGLNYYVFDLDTAETINKDFSYLSDEANGDISDFYYNLKENMMGNYDKEEPLEEYIGLSQEVYDNFYVETIGRKFLVLEEKNKLEKLFSSEESQEKLLNYAVISGVLSVAIVIYFIIMNETAFKVVSFIFKFILDILLIPIYVISAIYTLLSDPIKEMNESRKEELKKREEERRRKENEIRRREEERKRREIAAEKAKEDALKEELRKQETEKQEVARRRVLLREQEEQITRYKKEIENLKKQFNFESDIVLMYKNTNLPKNIFNAVKNAEKLYFLSEDNKEDYSPETTAYTNLIELLVKSVVPNHKNTKQQLGLNDSIKSLISDESVNPNTRNLLKELQYKLSDYKIIHIRNKASHYNNVSKYELDKVRDFLFDESFYKKDFYYYTNKYKNNFEWMLSIANIQI